ncbi:glycerate kinase, partial [Conexibacter sp. JD483]|uniref:glycerate kinase family protein n=2 Tax=Conexibacter TaxID=191494 RepID=UPI00286FF2F8
MTTRVLCAPDKLRGALDAAAAAAALAAGARAAGATAVELPIADGGEGTLDAFLAGASVVSVPVRDALGRPREARLARIDGGGPREEALAGRDGSNTREAALAGRDGDGSGARATAGTWLVEAAEAVPLHGLAADERDVLRASSWGVGQLIVAALDRGAARLLVAVGGTATMDGGAGMLAALGASCAHNGAGLLTDQSVRLAGLDPRLREVEVELLVDVAAPLTGPDGAARRFGPQKGATAAQVEALDAAHGRWAAALGIDPATPGAGAAGGLGAALQALGARTVAGAEAILDLKRFDALLADADLVLTAEGSVDASTLQGKAVAAVVGRCARAGVPVVVLGGRVEEAA